MSHILNSWPSSDDGEKRRLKKPTPSDEGGGHIEIPEPILDRAVEEACETPLTLEEQETAWMVQNAWRVSPLVTAEYFSELEDQRPRFESAAHLQLISDAIVEAVNGTGKKKIIISMPPRHGKSTLVTRRTPEWFLANNPRATVGVCGYGNSFAESWGRDIRNDVSRHYDLLGWKLAEDSQRKNWWHTDAGGSLWTAGIRGQITGKGADMLIIDDPIKDDQEAFSLVERDALWDWWQLTASSRTYPHSVTIVVMTRWHTDDLVGRLLSTKYPGDPSEWRVITLPALWEGDEPDEIGRHKGEALWPDGPYKFSAEWLATKKSGILPEYWETLYQQNPLNETGIGAVYHNFRESQNVTDTFYDHRFPICWSLDFNVNPMSAVLAQVKEEFAPNAYLTNEKLVQVNVLDEIVLPNSNTPEMCAEFLARVTKITKGHTYKIHVYGDATASRRDTRGAESDWDLVYRFLRDHQIKYSTFVTKTDPLQRDRANAMNMALRSPDGVVALSVDPRCKELILDLKEVRWKKDAAGNSTSQFDKNDQKRTHVSDALGYLVFTKFAINYRGGEQSGFVQ